MFPKLNSLSTILNTFKNLLHPFIQLLTFLKEYGIWIKSEIIPNDLLKHPRNRTLKIFPWFGTHQTGYDLRVPIIHLNTTHRLSRGFTNTLVSMVGLDTTQDIANQGTNCIGAYEWCSTSRMVHDHLRLVESTLHIIDGYNQGCHFYP